MEPDTSSVATGTQSGNHVSGWRSMSSNVLIFVGNWSSFSCLNRSIEHFGAR